MYQVCTGCIKLVLDGPRWHSHLGGSHAILVICVVGRVRRARGSRSASGWIGCLLHSLNDAPLFVVEAGTDTKTLSKLHSGAETTSRGKITAFL